MKIALPFLLATIAFLFSSSPAHAQLHNIVIESDATIPVLISGSDYATARLLVSSPDGVAFTVTGTWGIDFRTGTDWSTGEAKYFIDPSPSVVGTVTVRADGRPVDVGAALGATFRSQIKNDTRTCLTSADKAFARARYTPGDSVNLTVDPPLPQQITNIGAMIGILHITKSDGTPAEGATITIDNMDSVPAGDIVPANFNGDIRGIHRLNCSNSHRITATLGGETGFIDLRATRLSDTPETPGILCNGASESFDINLQPAATPTPTPTPTPAPVVNTAGPLSCSGSPPALSASWTGNTLNSCNIYIRAGVTDYQISTACNGSWSESTLPGGPAVVGGGVYHLYASPNAGGGTIDGGQATCPTVTPTATPIPTPTPVGALNLQVTATPICTTSPATERITASWQPIGSSYWVSLQGAPGGDESLCTSVTSKTFDKQPAMNGVYTVGASAYSDLTCLNYIQNSAETKSVPTNLACPTPTPTLICPATYTISGTVTKQTGGGVNNAVVCLDPPAGGCATAAKKATTNPSGSYSIAGVTSGGAGHNVYLDPASLTGGQNVAPPNPVFVGGSVCTATTVNFSTTSGPTPTPPAGATPTPTPTQPPSAGCSLSVNGIAAPQSVTVSYRSTVTVTGGASTCFSLTLPDGRTETSCGGSITRNVDLTSLGPGTYDASITNRPWGGTCSLSQQIVAQESEADCREQSSWSIIGYAFNDSTYNPASWPAYSWRQDNNNQCLAGNKFKTSQTCRTNSECNDGNTCTINDTCSGYRAEYCDDERCYPERLGTCTYENQVPYTTCETAGGNPTKLCSTNSCSGYQPASSDGETDYPEVLATCPVGGQSTCSVDYVSCTDPRRNDQFCCGLTNIQGKGCQGQCNLTYYEGSPAKAGIVVHADGDQCGLNFTRTTDSTGKANFNPPRTVGSGRWGAIPSRVNYTVWAEVPSGQPFTRGTCSNTFSSIDPVALVTVTGNRAICGMTLSGGGFNTGRASFGFTSYSISGEVFVDSNRNGSKDGGESCYNQPVTITNTDTSTGAATSHPLTSGCNYTFNVAEGTHQISLTPPVGYALTTPGTITKTLPPDQTGVDFGISDTFVWWQTKEGDVRAKTSISSRVPSGEFFSCNGSGCENTSGGSPGIVFYGSVGTASFFEGAVSSKNWIAREDFAGTVYAYDSLLSKVSQSGQVVSDFSCQPGNNCNSPPASSGVYKMAGDGNLTVSSDWTVKDSKKIVIFVPGNLEIQGGANKTNVDVAAGSFLAFIVKGNITVNSAIGRDPKKEDDKDKSNLEGWYITDGNFNTVDTGTSGKRLNIEGLVYLSQGALVNKDRDLGASNKTDPALFISYRTDLALNAPTIFSKSSIQWEEIAP